MVTYLREVSTQTVCLLVETRVIIMLQHLRDYPSFLSASTHLSSVLTQVCPTVLSLPGLSSAVAVAARRATAANFIFDKFIIN